MDQWLYKSHMYNFDSIIFTLNVIQLAHLRSLSPGVLCKHRNQQIGVGTTLNIK